MRAIVSTIATVIAAGLLLGCLERKETYVVQPDGGVKVTLELKGDPADFGSGDPLPTDGNGWTVKEELIQKKEGENEQTRHAERTFSAGADIPDCYGDAAARATALLTPTSVKLERRRDGTYIHFERRYVGREEARYAYYKERLAKDMDIKQLESRKFEELTADEQRKMIEYFRAVETSKHMEFVEAGLSAVEDAWPQDTRLALRNAMLEPLADAEIVRVLALLEKPESDERDEAIQAAAKNWELAGRRALDARLAQLRLPPAQVQTFRAAMSEEEQRRAVTEDLGDETWIVRVELPGTIVGHNGDKTEGNAVIWAFQGDALHDRDVLLQASCRLN